MASYSGRLRLLVSFVVTVQMVIKKIFHTDMLEEVE